MEQKKLFKILAAMLAMRADYYYKHKDYNTAIAYANAYDMVAYVANNRWDCLSQFSWADEAEDLINKVGADIDFYELEDLIREDKQNDC